MTTPTRPTPTPSRHGSLRRFLADRESALPWAGVRGYVSAVAAMPSPPPPSRWMAGVVGDGPAAAPELQEAVAGLVHLLDETIVALEAGTPPLPDDASGLADFTRGFLAASRLDRRWLEDDATLARLEALEQPTAAPDSTALAATVLGLFGRWAEAQDATGDEPPAALPRVGRNDPCPCGSGRKAKRCCGT